MLQFTFTSWALVWWLKTACQVHDIHQREKINHGRSHSQSIHLKESHWSPRSAMKSDIHQREEKNLASLFSSQLGHLSTAAVVKTQGSVTR